jgi:hypothetical protein
MGPRLHLYRSEQGIDSLRARQPGRPFSRGELAAFAALQPVINLLSLGDADLALLRDLLDRLSGGDLFAHPLHFRTGRHLPVSVAVTWQQDAY